MGTSGRVLTNLPWHKEQQSALYPRKDHTLGVNQHFWQGSTRVGVPGSRNMQSSWELSLEHPLNQWPEGRTVPRDCLVLVNMCTCPANQQTKLKSHPTGSKAHLVSWPTTKCCASFWCSARCLWIDFPLKSIYPVQPGQFVFCAVSSNGLLIPDQKIFY